MQYEARDRAEWQGAFKQEPSILSAAIEDAMKGAVPLAFAIQQSAECPLRVRLGRTQAEHIGSASPPESGRSADVAAGPDWAKLGHPHHCCGDMPDGK